MLPAVTDVAMRRLDLIPWHQMLADRGIGRVVGPRELLGTDALGTLPAHVIITGTTLDRVHHHAHSFLRMLILFYDLVIRLYDLGCACVDAVVIPEESTTARVHLSWVRRHERWLFFLVENTNYLNIIVVYFFF